MKKVIRLSESDLKLIIQKVLNESKTESLFLEQVQETISDLPVTQKEMDEADLCGMEDFTSDPELGGLFKKIFALPVDKLKNLYRDIKNKMKQNKIEEQAAAAAAATTVLGVSVPVILLGLVAIGVLTALISKIGGGKRGRYSGPSNCRTTRRMRSRGQGIWRDVTY